MLENTRRLEVDPASIEAIVCSHGHFDHTAGLDGLLRLLGPSRMPVLIHPHFWRRGRAVFPSREPQEFPATSPRAQELSRLRVRVAELEAAERKLNSERDILRAAAKYFAGETGW